MFQAVNQRKIYDLSTVDRKVIGLLYVIKDKSAGCSNVVLYVTLTGLQLALRVQEANELY